MIITQVNWQSTVNQFSFSLFMQPDILFVILCRQCAQIKSMRLTIAPCKVSLSSLLISTYGCWWPPWPHRCYVVLLLHTLLGPFWMGAFSLPDFFAFFQFSLIFRSLTLLFTLLGWSFLLLSIGGFTVKIESIVHVTFTSCLTPSAPWSLTWLPLKRLGTYFKRSRAKSCSGAGLRHVNCAHKYSSLFDWVWWDPMNTKQPRLLESWVSTH